MRKTIIILGSVLCQLAYATPITNTTNATATLAATCSISAQNISFGALATPLYAQSANSSMNVLCSKEAPYKIDLAFGDNGGYYLFRYQENGRVYRNYFLIYDKNNRNTLNQNYFDTSSGWLYPALIESNLGCKMTDPNAMYNSKCYIIYNSGKMTGGIKGDSVAYTIFIPNDSSKVWSVGKNSYSGIGTGSNQTIPVRAQIVPAESAAFPAPDFYSDTVVATITY